MRFKHQLPRSHSLSSLSLLPGLGSLYKLDFKFSWSGLTDSIKQNAQVNAFVVSYQKNANLRMSIMHAIYGRLAAIYHLESQVVDLFKVLVRW